MLTLFHRPQDTVATACVFFHRFFFRRSFRKFDTVLIAAGCVFLACKATEQLRRLRELTSVFHMERTGSAIDTNSTVCPHSLCAFAVRIR
jgi:hypothetical protein